MRKTKTYICRKCSAPFETAACYEKRGPNANSFCSVKCRNQSRIGKPSGMLGKKHSEATKRIIAVRSQLNRGPQTKFPLRMEWHCQQCDLMRMVTRKESKRKYCSYTCWGLVRRRPMPPCADCSKPLSKRENIRCHRCASNHRRSIPRLRLVPLNRAVRGMRECREWRTAIFRRDDFTCQICAVRGGRLNADHHPIPLSRLVQDFAVAFPDETLWVPNAATYAPFWDMSNGRTLCEDCHKETETYLTVAFRQKRRLHLVRKRAA